MDSAFATSGSGEHLLVVEPEELVRWSLVPYLARWFDVFSADSGAAADRILDEQRIDAAVVSDDLSDQAADVIEARVRAQNPCVKVVRVVTSPPPGDGAVPDTPCIEKPFQLSELATLLGVPDAPLCKEPEDTGRPSKQA
jgi:DNA-binding NtrC family response regulator